MNHFQDSLRLARELHYLSQERLPPNQRVAWSSLTIFERIAWRAIAISVKPVRSACGALQTLLGTPNPWNDLVEAARVSEEEAILAKAIEYLQKSGGRVILGVPDPALGDEVKRLRVLVDALNKGLKVEITNMPSNSAAAALASPPG
jgi:hypothetical protein